MRWVVSLLVSDYSFRSRSKEKTLVYFASNDFLYHSTVDGRNPAPPVLYEILWNMGYSQYQLWISSINSMSSRSLVAWKPKKNSSVRLSHGAVTSLAAAAAARFSTTCSSQIGQCLPSKGTNIFLHGEKEIHLHCSIVLEKDQELN